MPDIKFYTVEEVAKLLRVSEPTVRHLIESGQLRATKVGKQYRISEEALQDFIKRQTS